MQARYYDPVIGRFYSNDPVDTLGHMQRGNSIAHGFNRYAYANNNPYKYTDPDGRIPVAPLAVAGARACASNAACRGAVVKGAKEVAKGFAEPREKTYLGYTPCQLVKSKRPAWSVHPTPGAKTSSQRSSAQSSRTLRRTSWHSASSMMM